MEDLDALNTPMSATEAAEYIGVHPDTIVRWCRDRGLTHGKTPGGVYRIWPEDLHAFLGRDQNGSVDNDGS